MFSSDTNRKPRKRPTPIKERRKRPAQEYITTPEAAFEIQSNDRDGLGGKGEGGELVRPEVNNYTKDVRLFQRYKSRQEHLDECPGGQDRGRGQPRKPRIKTDENKTQMTL